MKKLLESICVLAVFAAAVPAFAQDAKLTDRMESAANVIEEVKKRLEEIKEGSFPPGMTFEVSYDVSTFLEASIEQIYQASVSKQPASS